jgi:hypothetical protein
VKPANVTVVYCWRCDAQVFYALLPLAVPRREVMLDAEPDPTGPLWVDNNGFAREVRTLYLDGEPRYTPHLLTCSALHDTDENDEPAEVHDLHQQDAPADRNAFEDAPCPPGTDGAVLP